jgi:hypothetical protein
MLLPWYEARSARSNTPREEYVELIFDRPEYARSRHRLASDPVLAFWTPRR